MMGAVANGGPASQIAWEAMRVGHFPHMQPVERERYAELERLVHGGCAFLDVRPEELGLELRSWDGTSDRAEKSLTPHHAVVPERVEVCTHRNTSSGATTIVHHIVGFDIPAGTSLQITFTPHVPDFLHGGFITEFMQTVRRADGSHYTYPPLHPHHIMVLPYPEAHGDRRSIFTDTFKPYYLNQVFVAGSPISAPQDMCDDNDPACQYLVVRPGLGIEQPKGVVLLSDSRLDNKGPSTLRSLTHEISWTWRPRSCGIRPILQAWFAAERTMGHGYSILRGVGETMVWRTYVMPSGGVFHAGSLVHIHSRLGSHVWVLSQDAQRVLPPQLTALVDPFGRYTELNWTFAYDGSWTNRSPLPLELREVGLSSLEVQNYVLTHHSDAVRCIFKGSLHPRSIRPRTQSLRHISPAQCTPRAPQEPAVFAHVAMICRLTYGTLMFCSSALVHRAHLPAGRRRRTHAGRSRRIRRRQQHGMRKGGLALRKGAASDSFRFQRRQRWARHAHAQSLAPIRHI